MILTMWIAVRMTIITLEGDPGAGSRKVDLIAAQSWHDAPAGPASGAAPTPQQRRAAMPDRTRPQLLQPFTDRPVQGVTAPRLADFVRLGTSPPAVPPAAALAGKGDPGGPRLSYLAAAGRNEAGSLPPAGASPQAAARPRSPRWSADGWIFVRGGDVPPSLATGAASYGGSQAGAVLRYGLVPASRMRPQAYLRLSGALGGGMRQNEAAFGFSLRPVRGLPLAVMGEVRAQDQGGPVRARPVVMAVTELAPLRLPFRAEAEAYAQGGWAGGRDATAFYDLAVTLQRRVFRPLSGVALSAGGGVWSGGQRGAARLDVGPRIELRGMIGPPARRIGVRVGVDWRFRVAGDAAPGSGPALTVAAGF